MIKIRHSSPGRLFALFSIGAGFISIGLMFLLLLNQKAVSTADHLAVPAKVEFAAPNLTLEDVAGNPVSFDEHRGSVVLVNLWATWCPPCRQEMPALQDFYEKYESHGFVLIGIDQEEPLETIILFVEEMGLTFPIWLDPEYQAQTKFNTIGLPSSYVIDREGVVRLMWVGGISARNLEKFVPPLILE